YLAAQYAVGVSGRGLCITWSSANAPLFTVGDVLRGRWLRQFQPERGTLLSWLMSNYWLVNHQPRQSGQMTFRYAFVPSPSWEPDRASRFGREVRIPTPVTELSWLDKGDTGYRPLPAGQGQLLQAELPANLVATVLNPRLSERGLLVRLQETAGRSTRAQLLHPNGAAGVATHCTAAEEPIGELPVSADGAVGIDVAPYAVATVVLTGKSATT
ncbi:MAG: hypothetical protein J2P17_24175, partial [Mycobacterium sp.]|nr:hypothetical protein [Mycobacterium sp.]